jgi:hypothetical protein
MIAVKRVLSLQVSADFKVRLNIPELSSQSPYLLYFKVRCVQHEVRRPCFLSNGSPLLAKGRRTGATNAFQEVLNHQMEQSPDGWVLNPRNH